MRSPFVLLALTLATASPSRHGAGPAELAPPRFEMSADTVSVPMHLQSGRILLDVKVNGQGPFPFILDTGAHGSVFDFAFAQEMKLPLGDTLRVASPNGRGLGARLATITGSRSAA